MQHHLAAPGVGYLEAPKHGEGSHLIIYRLRVLVNHRKTRTRVNKVTPVTFRLKLGAKIP